METGIWEVVGCRFRQLLGKNLAPAALPDNSARKTEWHTPRIRHVDQVAFVTMSWRSRTPVRTGARGYPGHFLHFRSYMGDDNVVSVDRVARIPGTRALPGPSVLKNRVYPGLS